jgi:hypothetical protein
LVATNLAVDKECVKLDTLIEAIVADIGTDKEASLPTQAELRERWLRDLIHHRGRPVALFIYAWRALEEAYIAGQKPVDAETVHDVLVPDLDGLEPRLMRLGYPVKSLCEALNVRPAEIRAFVRGRLAQGRMQELHQELHKLGVVA